jgi:hypothetical protein
MKFNLKKIIIYFILNIILFLTVSAFISGKPEIKSYRSINYINKKEDTLTAEIEAEIYNPNFFSIGGKNITSEINWQDKIFCRGEIGSFKIKQRSTDIVIIKFKCSTVDLKNIYKNSNDEIKFNIIINGDFKPLFFVKKINTELMMVKKDMQKLVLQAFLNDNDIKFDSFKVNMENPIKTNINFNINLINTLGFEYTVNKIETEFSPNKNNDMIFANWHSKKKFLMIPDQKATIEGELSLNNMALVFAGISKKGKNMNKFYMNGKVDVSIDNKENFEAQFNFPVKIENGTVEIINETKDEDE